MSRRSVGPAGSLTTASLPATNRREYHPSWAVARPPTRRANRARFKGMNALSNWPRNRLLLALPSRNLKRLMPELEHIRCQRAAGPDGR